MLQAFDEIEGAIGSKSYLSQRPALMAQGLAAGGYIEED
jgi:hypothetical protein